VAVGKQANATGVSVYACCYVYSSLRLNRFGLVTWHFTGVQDVADVFKEHLVHYLAVCQQEGHLPFIYTTHLVHFLQIIPELCSAISAPKNQHKR